MLSVVGITAVLARSAPTTTIFQSSGLSKTDTSISRDLLFGQVLQPSPCCGDAGFAFDGRVLDHLAQAVLGMVMDEGSGVVLGEALVANRSSHIGWHQNQPLSAAVHSKAARPED